MKRAVVYVVNVLFLALCSMAIAKSAEAPGPFGLVIGETSYEEALNVAQQRNWRCQEYEKRHFKAIGKKDLTRGKNTFVKATAKGMEGIRSILIFFDGESTLDAVIIILDPKLFDVVFQQLDGKYKLVEKSLKGEYLSSDYPYVLWQQNNVLIELQKPSPYRTRLLYVEKTVYENYREFLNKHYPRYRHTQERRGWMDEL
ncbi:MAG: hypothetical protein JSU72_14490 [Deltaproteobacteria bacterium]|nr:MAG: hypothetical protein JSU72_14490 [Deltaproteobacteria bacterium]